MREILASCADREISPAIALVRLVVAYLDLGALRSDLAAARQSERESRLRTAAERIDDLLASNLSAGATVLKMLREEHTAVQADDADEVERWRRLFNRLVRDQAEASVALYSLGRPDLLDDATAEVVGLLDRLAVLQPERHMLEIGCGIGRFQEALAGRVAAITGIDVADGMIEAAKRRCAALPNVTLAVTQGRDLRQFPDGSFDAVLAIDTMPYLVRAGGTLVEAHVTGSARVLRRGGDLVILNFSYRGDLDRDRQDLAALAEAADLHVIRNGTADLRLWDGATFHLRKP